MVALGFESPANLAQQQTFATAASRKRLLSGAESPSWRTRSACDGRIRLFNLEEYRQLGGVHNRQQVVNLEAQVVRQTVDVARAAFVDSSSRSPAMPPAARGAHLVVHLPLVGIWVRPAARVLGGSHVRLVSTL